MMKRSIGTMLVGVLLVLTGSTQRGADAAPRACGVEARTTTAGTTVHSCDFAFTGNPIVIRGFAVGRGTVATGLGVRRPPDVFMDASVFRTSGGPTILRCVDLTTVGGLPTDPLAVCAAAGRASSLAIGTGLRCFVRVFNDADSDRRTTFSYRCSSG